MAITPLISVLCGAKVSFICNDRHGAFRLGDTVAHAVHQRGVILEAWGNDCYEVRFQDGLHSVNRCRLSLVEAAPKIHSFAQKFPVLSGEDYQALRESIRANGQLAPIVVGASGEILDGRHRFRACVSLGLTPKTIQFSELSAKSPDTLSPEQFIYSMNAERRHLTATQRAVLALAFLPFARKEAKARIRAGADRARRIRYGGNGEEPAAPVRTRDVLAERAGVSPITIDRVLAVNNHAPELLPAMANGELAATRAEKLVRAKKKKLAEKRAETFSHATPFSKEIVLRQWKTVWSAFVLRFPPRRRKEVRQIVMAHLTAQA